MSSERSMTWDQRRCLRALLSGMWAAFFIYLWWSNEQVRYIGPRTLWVIPFGAISLSLATIAHFPFLRSREPTAVRRSELVGAIITILPIALVVMAPAPELGSLAASKKSGTTGLASAIAFAPPVDGGRDVSFIDVHYAGLSEEYALSAGIVDGRPLTLTGFVTHDDNASSFRLTRFYVSCCAADAIPYSVTIDAAGRDFPDDTWMRVEGTLRPSETGFILEAERIEELESPKDPYLS
jgi:uncharacterized repeat protein (TIGR03943 family)